VLAFQLSDGNYCAVICAKVTQQRGNCTYDLVATSYKSKTKPTIEGMKECFIGGRKIGSGFDPDTTLGNQPNVDEIWEYTRQSNFFFGLPYDLVTHKDMINLKDKFEIVGKLKLKEGFKKDGSYGYRSSFDEFEDIFSDLEGHFKVCGIKKYPVALLCEQKL
jgi:hypothetical protein